MNRINNAPLIVPGNYDISYNQQYLLEKLERLDVYTNIFWIFWASIFLSILLYGIIKIIKSMRLRARRQQWVEEQKIKEIERQVKFEEFHAVCNLIYEDLYTFKRPAKMVEKMYDENLKELIHEISKMQPYMKKHYGHLIYLYEFHRKRLIKDEVDGAE